MTFLLTTVCEITVQFEYQMSISFAQENSNATVDGVVTDLSTGFGISDAVVSLKQNRAIIKSSTTLNNGAYSLQAPPGNYDITVSKRSFKESIQAIVLISFETVTLNTELVPIQVGNDINQTVKTIGIQKAVNKISEAVFGFVEGFVFNSGTEVKISGAKVTLSSAGKTVVTLATTNTGAYFIQAAPGIYNISASKEGFAQNDFELFISAFKKTSHNMSLIVVKDDDVTPTPLATVMTTPTVISTPTSVPTETEIHLCEGGGIPESIKLSTNIVRIKAGKSANVLVQVFKEQGVGCSTEVNIECIKGCEMLNQLDNTVFTNESGAISVVINTNKRTAGLAKLVFSVGDLRTNFFIIIKKFKVNLKPES